MTIGVRVTESSVIAILVRGTKQKKKKNTGSSDTGAPPSYRPRLVVRKHRHHHRHRHCRCQRSTASITPLPPPHAFEIFCSKLVNQVGICLTEPCVLDVGFFLEGGHRVLGCVRINNLKLAAAEPLLLPDSVPPPPPPPPEVNAVVWSTESKQFLVYEWR